MSRDFDSLTDILDAAQRITTYTQAMTEAEFQADFKTQDAVVRCLEIIGEATKRLSPILRQNHPLVPWQTMAGVRDVLIHAYDKVDTDLVWKTVVEAVPQLIRAVEPIRSKLDASD